MTSPTVRDLDYLGHLKRESARFAHAIDLAAPDAPVRACPGWTADDLLWHLSEVQWFWATIVREGLTSPGQAEALKPERPPGRTELAEFFATASRDLLDVLTTAAPQTPAWTWADDKTVGFIRRRQAHEALIHRLDAELAASNRTAMDPLLSADGVDEALRLIYGGDLPAWGAFTPDATLSLRVRATDTADTWLVLPGHLSGTDPQDGKSYDEPGIHVLGADEGAEAAAAISGTAADLDSWLWRRPTLAPLDQIGNPDALAAFESVIAAGVS